MNRGKLGTLAGGPVAAQEGQADAEKSPAIVFRVVMVDDDFEDFVLVKRLLRSVGNYTITHIDDADEAREVLKKGGYDVALIDGHIKGQSGIDLIREMAPESPMPLVLVTAHGNPHYDLVALEAGAADFIDKSDLSSRLLARVLRYAHAQFKSEMRLRDSERRMREAKEQAEEASFAKSQFLAHMSHELRTPLNAILGFSEMMRQEVLGPIGHERYKDYLQDVHTSGMHLLNLINDILDLSKIESGQKSYDVDEVNIAALFDETVRLVRQHAADKGLKVNVNADPSLILLADHRAVKQMLLNLLSNSVKFTRPGGEISLLGEITPVSVKISVSDNGIGIAEEKLKKVLEPFVQVQQELYQAEPGTGLGLSIVKSLIHDHDGWLEVLSSEDVGTVATLHFPRGRLILPDAAEGAGRQTEDIE